MSATTTTVAAILKRLYPAKRVNNMVYKDHPLMALMPKIGGFTGSAIAIPIRYSDTQGRSHDFATAQALTGNFAAKQFLLTRVKDYAVYSLETEAILATNGDMGAYVKALDTEISSALNNLSKSLAMQVYRDGLGDLGTVTVSGAGPYTFTLANPEDVTNFEVGQTVVFSNGSTRTNALRNSGGGVAITNVDRDAGTFTTATNPDSAATGDYVFSKGDRIAGSAASVSTWTGISGVEAWNPVTAPAASESFFGVDRSADASRLGGIRLDISSYNPEEGLVIAMMRLAREGGSPDYFLSNYKNIQNIQLALGSKVETEYTTVGDIGFSSIRVTGPKGDVRCIADQDAPVGIGRLLTMSSWEFHHLGDFINILDLDGNQLSRKSTADEFEGRAAFYGNIGNNAPGHNARLVMP